MFDAWRIHSDDGRYTVNNVFPGSLDILVRASGYADATHRGVDAVDGKTISGIDIQLDRAAHIVGRVTSAGEPVAGVQVSVDLNPFTQSGLSAISDRDGLYVIEGITAGDHHIRFDKLGFFPVSKPFVLADGELRLDIALDSGHELRGRIVDRSGSGVPDVSVNVGLGSTATDSEGVFVLRGIPEGHYTVSAQKSGHAPAEANIELPQTQPLTLTLDPGATINGRVVGLSPQQLAGVVVRADDADNGRTYGRTRVDDRGNFIIPGMPEGRVRIEASWSSRQAPSKTVMIKNGVAPIVEMNFADGITVSGRVSKNGVAPPPNGIIVFDPSPHSADRNSSTTLLSPDGSYEVTGLTAGDYDVTISGSGFGFRTKYRATANAKLEIDMRGALLRGQAVDSANRAPLANVHVVISDAPGGPSESDSEGRFSADGLADGDHLLYATREGYTVAPLRFVVSNGTVPDIEVRMQQVPATVIHVVDAATGEPVRCDITLSGPNGLVMGRPIGVGATKVWVTPGSYQINVHAEGYPSKWVDVTISGSDVKLSIAH
jgi:hypothetical protein